MECKDYIGKLVYEQFKQIEGKNAVLEKRNAELSTENDKLLETLKKLTDLIASRIVKRENGEVYIGSFWGEDSQKIFDLLGFGEEERDDTISDQ